MKLLSKKIAQTKVIDILSTTINHRPQKHSSSRVCISGVPISLPSWTDRYSIDFHSICSTWNSAWHIVVNILTLGMPAKQICEVSIFRESFKMETFALFYSASSTINKSNWTENIKMFNSIWQQKYTDCFWWLTMAETE